MTTLRPGRRDTSPADADALIQEARRRQRRRCAKRGAVIAVVAAAAAGTLAGLSGGAGPRPRPTASQPVPRPAAARVIRGIGSSVLLWPAPDPATIVNLQTGQQSRDSLGDAGIGDYQPSLISAGAGWIVYAGDGTTAIRSDLEGAPRVLGSTSFFAPSFRPGHVWLIYVSPNRAAPERARLVAVAGGPPGPVITLPAGAQLVAGLQTGLLIQAADGTLQLWHAGASPRSLPFHPGWSDGFGATGQLVAYGTGCGRTMYTSANAAAYANAGYDVCRMLRILDVRTGRLTSYPAPRGTEGWVPYELNRVDPFAPDNTMMAAEAVLAATGTPGHRSAATISDSGRLYVLPVNGRPAPAEVPLSAGFVLSELAWSTAGDWLLYSGPGRHLTAYRPATGVTRKSATACCAETVMVTMPAPG
jgi:hypothetical protein